MALGGLRLQPLLLVGGIALIVASFLGWLRPVLGGANGWDVPFGVLWNSSGPSHPRLGLLALILGIIAIGGSFLARQVAGAVGIVGGVLGALISGLYLIQMVRALSDSYGASASDSLGNAIGIGPWVALGGAVLLLVGGIVALSRRS